MSAESKKARAEKREQFRTEQIEEREQTARLVGIWLEHGEGWRWAVCDIPRSVIERYCVSVGAPDVLQIAIAKAEEALETHAAKGVLR